MLFVGEFVNVNPPGKTKDVHNATPFVSTTWTVKLVVLNTSFKWSIFERPCSTAQSSIRLLPLTTSCNSPVELLDVQIALNDTGNRFVCAWLFCANANKAPANNNNGTVFRIIIL